jgi:hypothetical protein
LSKDKRITVQLLKEGVIMATQPGQFQMPIEGQWAAFFDALGIPYEYQGDTHSLPLFWLPTLSCFIRASSQLIDGAEARSLYRIAVETQRKVYLFITALPRSTDTLPTEEMMVSGQLFSYSPHPSHTLYGVANIVVSLPFWWCECPVCGAVGLAYFGYADRLACGCVTKQNTPSFATPRLLHAYDQAQKLPGA